MCEERKMQRKCLGMIGVLVFISGNQTNDSINNQRLKHWAQIRHRLLVFVLFVPRTFLSSAIRCHFFSFVANSNYKTCECL